MTIKEAKDFLRSEGYFVDHLWHVSDVQDNFICDEEEAQDVLYWALTDGHVCNTIQNKINEVSNNECLEEKDDEDM